MQKALRLDEQQYRLLKYWLPALLSGGIAWVLFLLLGGTPLLRASGLALVIVGLTLALRRMGSGIAIVGAFTLAFSPIFWSQTGGAEGGPASIVIALLAATVGVTFAVVLTRRPQVGLWLGVLVFSVLFLSQLGTPQSIRLTGFVMSWLLFLLLDMLLLTNPHPSDAPPILLDGRKASEQADDYSYARGYHTLGILLLFTVGVLNDPLLTLLAPAVVLALLLTRTDLPSWYWAVLMLVIGFGLRGLAVDYLQALAAHIDLMRWRNAFYWLDLLRLIVAQFTWPAVLLSVLGLARLSRWYPPIGTVTLVAYAAYTFFGLVYSGPNREILLLPLLIIHVVWLAYALFALSEWMAQSMKETQQQRVQLAMQALFGLLPLLLLWQIVAGG
jgi:hypothetical protein